MDALLAKYSVLFNYSQQIIKKSKQNILKRVNAKVLISVSWFFINLYILVHCEYELLQLRTVQYIRVDI